MSTSPFSPELHSELALSLDAYASTGGAPAEDERIDRAIDHVCREAHGARMSAESMIIALHAAYDSVNLSKHVDATLLRRAFDRLMSRCIRAYFEQQQRMKS